jgi:DNA polymerase I
VQAGKEASLAVDGALRATSINKLLNTFIVPLQSQADAQFRIHSSMNLNTETGRLSCRRPNLQNQPALEKDRYRVRMSLSE